MIRLARDKTFDGKDARLFRILCLLKEILMKIKILRQYQSKAFDPVEFEAILDIVFSYLSDS